MKFGLKAIFIIFLTAFFCIYPPFRNFKQNYVKAAFDYFAADAFYYLNVADKYQKAGFSSFDGNHPTNGFHPLWQNILNISFSKIQDPISRINFVFFLSVFLVTLGYVFVALAISKIYESSAISIFAIIPGFLFVFFSFILFPYGSPWSFMNGMETPLSVFMFGIFILFLSSNNGKDFLKQKNLLIFSLLLTILGFARLDDFFLLLAFSIFILINSEQKDRLKNSFLILTIPAISIVVYLINNKSYSDFFLPVSGLMKSNFSFDNLIYTFSSFFSIWIKDNFFGEHAFWRIILLYFPLITALLFLLKIKSKGNNNLNFLIPLSFYVIFKSIYNLFFVNFWDQGHWYFALSILITNILIMDFVSRIKLERKNGIVFSSILLIVTFVFANSYMEKYRFKENIYYEFWKNRDVIENQIANVYDGKGVIEFDDGIIAWSLNYPTLSGTGFSLDKEAFEFYKKGDFLDLAYSRGFKALASLVYINPSKEILYDNAKLNKWIKSSFPALKNQNLKSWTFELKHYDSRFNFYLISFKNFRGKSE
jgi:hypothetical protein